MGIKRNPESRKRRPTQHVRARDVLLRILEVLEQCLFAPYYSYEHIPTERWMKEHNKQTNTHTHTGSLVGVRVLETGHSARRPTNQAIEIGPDLVCPTLIAIVTHVHKDEIVVNKPQEQLASTTGTTARSKNNGCTSQNIASKQ